MTYKSHLRAKRLEKQWIFDDVHPNLHCDGKCVLPDLFQIAMIYFMSFGEIACNIIWKLGRWLDQRNASSRWLFNFVTAKHCPSLSSKGPDWSGHITTGWKHIGRRFATMDVQQSRCWQNSCCAMSELVPTTSKRAKIPQVTKKVYYLYCRLPGDQLRC